MLVEAILVSNWAVSTELNRAASKGLLSTLSASKLNELALKYFGIYENGELVGAEEINSYYAAFGKAMPSCIIKPVAHDV